MRLTTVAVMIQIVHSGLTLVNLSVNKSADMSSSQYSDKWLAGEAVDGDVSQNLINNSCAVTSYDQKPQVWWRVDLGAVQVVNRVTIYYRKEVGESFTFRLSGFSIYVSDTLNWWNGVRCYQNNGGVQDNPGPSDIFTVKCDAAGRYITLYKQRKSLCLSFEFNINFCAIFELCEVQVFGCDDNTFGATCQGKCSGNCLHGVSCNKAHGGCDKGCDSGYHGFYCDQACSRGKYGPNCSKNCSENCVYQNCNIYNGKCKFGCKDGWRGDNCTARCEEGTCDEAYNIKCEGYCLNGGRCNRTNGRCDNGCAAGFKGPYCLEKCDKGRYGPDCSANCSVNCQPEEDCDIYNGSCAFGCKEGWHGTFCNDVCKYGYYGKECSSKCRSCAVTCHHVTGECLSLEGAIFSLSKEKNSVIIGISCALGVTFVSSVVMILVVFCRKGSSKRKEDKSKSQSEISIPVQKIENTGRQDPHYENVHGLQTVYDDEGIYYETENNLKDNDNYDHLQIEIN